jgi:hypothetical protein
MDDEHMQNAPIFIIGNPRSGTTMLRLMLASHAHIGIPPESGWLIELYSKYSQEILDETNLGAFVDDLLAVPKIEEWHLDRAKLFADLQQVSPANYSVIASQIYQSYLKRHGNKRRWGDKNNFYLNHIGKLNALFPRALFLHIVRDGRDVACSYRDLAHTKGLYAPILPSSVCQAALHWNRNIGRIRKSLAQIDSKRTLTIRYEDLVNNPQVTLQDVCTFLGEDFDDRMLSFAEINKSENLEPDIFMSWKALTKQPLTTARAGRWKREMFQEDQFLFEYITRNTLVAYEYEVPDRSSPFSPSNLYLRGYALLSFGIWYGQALLRKAKRGLGLHNRQIEYEQS